MGFCEGGGGRATATRWRDTTSSSPSRIVVTVLGVSTLHYKNRPILVVACGVVVRWGHLSPVVLETIGKLIVPRLRASRGRLGRRIYVCDGAVRGSVGLGLRDDSIYPHEKYFLVRWWQRFRWRRLWFLRHRA